MLCKIGLTGTVQSKESMKYTFLVDENYDPDILHEDYDPAILNKI